MVIMQLTPGTHLDCLDLGVDAWPQVSAVVHHDGTVTLRWIEYLDFHTERSREDDIFSECDYDGQRWLTDPALQCLSRLAAHRWRGALIDVDGEDSSAHFVASWNLNVNDLDVLIQCTYALCARVANETDPGTFGSPYIFDLVVRELRSH